MKEPTSQVEHKKVTNWLSFATCVDEKAKDWDSGELACGKIIQGSGMIELLLEWMLM